jgi:hypothetical protein
MLYVDFLFFVCCNAFCTLIILILTIQKCYLFLVSSKRYSSDIDPGGTNHNQVSFEHVL